MIATWRALNGGWPLTRIAPNCATGPGSTGRIRRRKMGLVIDLDVLLADLRLGEALLAERTCQGMPAGDDVLRR